MTNDRPQGRVVPRWKRALVWLDGFADASDRRDAEDLHDRITKFENQVAALTAEGRCG